MYRLCYHDTVAVYGFPVGLCVLLVTPKHTVKRAWQCLCVYRLSCHVTAAGAILVLGRDLVMVPKLIHPLPPTGPGTPKSPAYGEPIEEEPPTPHPMTDTWMQVREATPATLSMHKL